MRHAGSWLCMRREEEALTQSATQEPETAVTATALGDIAERVSASRWELLPKNVRERALGCLAYSLPRNFLGLSERRGAGGSCGAFIS
jgi:hypothetical protein